MPFLPLRVLVLEDHAFQRSVAVKMLQALGCGEVFQASDGARALAVLQAVGAVDIALCDLQMEGMDGLDFLQRVGATGQVKAFIISSSLSGDLRPKFNLRTTQVCGVEVLCRGMWMMGCRLSIDDFGTGFSSLQRLCQLPFNEIKLDGEFVRTLEHEPRCRAVISSTLELGESLGMSVVIEGIETDAQRQQLLALGCPVGQGYWYARPMSGEGFLRWLRQRDESQIRP